MHLSTYSARPFVTGPLETFLFSYVNHSLIIWIRPRPGGIALFGVGSLVVFFKVRWCRRSLNKACSTYLKIWAGNSYRRQKTTTNIRADSLQSYYSQSRQVLAKAKDPTRYFHQTVISEVSVKKQKYATIRDGLRVRMHIFYRQIKYLIFSWYWLTRWHN